MCRFFGEQFGESSMDRLRRLESQLNKWFFTNTAKEMAGKELRDRYMEGKIMLEKDKAIFTDKEDRQMDWDPWPIGWRARIGFIVPSIEPGVMQHEYSHMFPRGVVMLDTKIMLKTGTPEAFAQMSEEAVYAAELLATSKVDVICYHCAAGGLINGVAYEQGLIKKIEEASGAKGTTLSLAGLEALKDMGVKKIVVANPHVQALVDAEEKYLLDAGFDVLKTKALDIEDPLEIAARSPWDNYRFVLDVYREAPEAEAIFISCGIFRSIEIIEYLEKATGKYVVSSASSNAWKCLQLAGIKEPISGFGSLLARER
jgi:maleate isomerase